MSLDIYTSANKKIFSGSQMSQRSPTAHFLSYPMSTEPAKKKPRYQKKRETCYRNCHNQPAALLVQMAIFLVEGLEQPYLRSLQLHHFAHLPVFGNHLSLFQPAWEPITFDKWSLEVITSCYSIHFTSVPCHFPVPFHRFIS